VIRADGTLDREAARRAMAAGGLDPRGWNLVADAAGTPHFVRGERLDPGALVSTLPEIGDDDDWDGGFGGFAIDGDIYAIAVDGDNVYVGGSFDIIDGLTVHRIAMWDGTDWRALGSGINGDVYALAVSDGNLYVGGQFTTAGGVAAGNFAVWNTRAREWGSVGSVTAPGYSYISVLTVRGSDVLIGGSFTSAGSVAAGNIVGWSISARAFFPLGTGTANGTNGDVLAIGVRGHDIIVGGYFQTAGGDSMRSIARWNDSAGRWLPLAPQGISGYVNAIAVGPNRVYIGGRIDSVGGSVAWNMATWMGGLEPMIGGTKPSILTGIVQALTVYRNFIIAAGAFKIAYPTVATDALANVNHVAYWDRDTIAPEGWEARWHSLDVQSHAGVDGYATAVAAANNSVYVGGIYRMAGGRIKGRIARWQMHTLYPDIQNPNERGAWYAVGVGVATSAPVTAIATRTDEVYVATGTVLPDGHPVSTIAMYNGARWTILAPPIEGSVNALELIGGDLYVGGRFDRIVLPGGETLHAVNIARYNIPTRGWYTLDSGLIHWDRPDDSSAAFVNALVADGADLYVGGQFDQAGRDHLPVSNIARWESRDNRWVAMNRGVYGSVKDVAVAPDGAVHIAGRFIAAADPMVKYLARWDGAAWRRVGAVVGDTVDNTINAIAIGGDGMVYIGGDFTRVAGDSVGFIARWDGSRWSGLGRGIGGDGFPRVNDLTIDGRELYVAGSFALAGGDSASNIAEWDGRSWWRLGSGSDLEIRAMRTLGNYLYVGGYFEETGRKPSAYFGRWNRPTLGVPLEDDAAHRDMLRLRQLSGDAVEIAFPGAPGAELALFDMRGERVMRIVPEVSSFGEMTTVIDCSALPRGAYICRYRGRGMTIARSAWIQ
jgi:hypothetical protein